MSAFENFVNLELPKRPVMLSLANTGYDNDPNGGGAPAVVQNSPQGTFFFRTTGNLVYIKNTSSPGSWAAVGSGGGTWTPPSPGASRTITVPAGIQPGIQTTGAQAQILGEILRIVGTPALATLATGANTGTAGAGSNSAQLNKPTAVAAWTAGNLVGHFAQPLTGPCMPADGSPLFIPIVSNTTTAAFFDAPVPGFDSTCTFQIVDLATKVGKVSSLLLNAIDIRELYGRVEIYGIDFSTADALDSLIYGSDVSYLKVSGCAVSINTANPSVFLERCLTQKFEHLLITNGGDIKVSEGFTVSGNGFYANAGGVISIEDCHTAKLRNVRSVNAPSRVVELINVHKAQLECNASAGGATPVYLEDCARFTPLGTLITGSGNTGYGVEIQGSGNYNLVGVNLTGSLGDLNFLGDATLWSVLSNPAYGSVQKWGASAFGMAGFSKTLLRGNLGMEGALDVGGRLLTFGYFNLAANTSTIPLLAGYTLDMERSKVFHSSDGLYYPTGTESPRAVAVVSCNAAGAQIMLPDAAAIAGALCIIINLGAFAGTVIAPNTAYKEGGSTGPNAPNGTIFGSINTVNANGISTFISLNTNGAHDFAGVFQS